MITPEERKQNELLRENFLIDRPIETLYKLPEFSEPFGYVYCIENKNSGKKYVGSTYSIWTNIQNPGYLNQLRKRASQYIYEYNCIRNMKSNAKKMSRPISIAMATEGLENFIMYPLAETTKENHLDAETYFIRKLDTMNNGYNVRSTPFKCRMIGNTMSPEDKLRRSEEIISINVNNKKIVISDSMKLFGDFLGTTKDIIKNSVRLCRPRSGWFSFYTNWDKRQDIINNTVLNIDNADQRFKHSEKSKAFYVEFNDQITTYLTKTNSELFSDYTIEYLRYKE